MVCVAREVAELQHWSGRQRLSVFKRIIPERAVATALRGSAHRGSDDCPRVPDVFMVWFVIALGLFCRHCYRQVYRWLLPFKRRDIPGRSTLCMARQRVGVAPPVRLAAAVVKLLADPAANPGAFYRGMRLMALDGFVQDVPDHPANDRAFGRPGNQRSPGAFPQVRVVGLVECGTHVFWRFLIKGCRASEQRMTGPLLRRLLRDMLLMWDRGFLSYEHVRQVVGRHAQLLARIKNNLIFKPVEALGDGSYLSKIYRNAADRTADRNGILVRIIEYTLDDPGRAGTGERHRLLTTLLDPKLDPAATLVELYHARWEEELGIDEVKTHELQRPVLRSQTPAGVVQEVYGLMLAHYVLRATMHEAAGAAAVPVSPLRLSFTATLTILQCRLPECPRGTAGRRRWWDDLIAEIGEEVIPPRRDRVNPRVIKKQQSKWPKKRPEHYHCPQPTKKFRESIVVLR
jgi:hypothetical protein